MDTEHLRKIKVGDALREPTKAEFEAGLEKAAEISAVFSGLPTLVIGSMLADLTATWLAGHVVEGSPELTKDLRIKLLDTYLKMTVALIKPNTEEIGTDLLEKEGGSH